MSVTSRFGHLALLVSLALAFGLLLGESTVAQQTLRQESPVSPELSWLQSRAIPAAARAKLLPLYQEQQALLRELNYVKWRAATDTIGGLAGALAGLAIGNAAKSVTDNAAARARQPGAKFRGEDPVLSASEPLDEIPSVARAAELLRRVDQVDRQIAQVRRQYNVTTIGPATLRPRELSRSELDKMLAQIAVSAALPVGDPLAFSSNDECKVRSRAARDILQACRDRLFQCYNACDEQFRDNDLFSTKTIACKNSCYECEVEDQLQAKLTDACRW